MDIFKDFWVRLYEAGRVIYTNEKQSDSNLKKDKLHVVQEIHSLGYHPNHHFPCHMNDLVAHTDHRELFRMRKTTSPNNNSPISPVQSFYHNSHGPAGYSGNYSGCDLITIKAGLLQMIGILLENRFAATHFERFVEATEHYLGSAGLTASPYGMNLTIPICP